MPDTIIIGAGLAGLTAAIRLAEQGQSVTVCTFGLGGIQLGQGTVDVLGYVGSDKVEVKDRLVTHPFDDLPAFAQANPGHPYALLDPAQVRAGVDWLAEQVPDVLLGGDGTNRLVPTALGAMRPTYLVQPSMVWPEGIASLAVVGPQQCKDFYPGLAAANLTVTAGVTATGYRIDLPARDGEVDSLPTVYAARLDTDEFLARFAAEITKVIHDEEAVAVPAILGLKPTTHARLADLLGRPLIEVLLGPPSIPGMRLNEALTARAKACGVRFIIGSKVTGYTADATHITGLTLGQAGRDETLRADNVLYAGGGFESGALAMDSYGVVQETLFNLPLAGVDTTDVSVADAGPARLITEDYWASQPLFALGVAVDAQMRPIGADKQPVYSNLRVGGGLLAGAIRWSEKSGDGIAIASAVCAADAIASSTPTPTEQRGNR